MIKAGITDADTDLAGELIRILLNHTDVEIVAAHCPALAGKPLSARHHGLIGETDLNFTERISPEDLDILIICGDSDFSRSLLEHGADYPELRIIYAGYKNISSLSDDFALGLSEINRKQLVRGARKAYILSPVVTALLAGIYPLGFNMMLNSDLKIDLELPASDIPHFNASEEAATAKKYLQNIQKSFDSEVSFNLRASESRRGMRLSMTIPVKSDISEIQSVYDNIYDDHNFAFTVGRSLAMKEVVGTHKCLITLCKESDDRLRVEILADSRMRGAAGEIVHLLNLLFGLHERTGLALKASSV